MSSKGTRGQGKWDFPPLQTPRSFAAPLLRLKKSLATQAVNFLYLLIVLRSVDLPSL